MTTAAWRCICVSGFSAAFSIIFLGFQGLCEWPTVRKHVSKITHAFQGNTTSFLTKHIMYTNTWQIGFWSSCTAIGWQNDVLNTMYWGALRFQGVLKWVWRPNITQPWLYSQPMSGVKTSHCVTGGSTPVLWSFLSHLPVVCGLLLQTLNSFGS